MVFEPTFSLGNIATIVATLMVGVGFVWAIKASTMVLAIRLDDTVNRISALEEDTKAINKVLIDMAAQSGRLNLMDERTVLLSKRIEEFQRIFNNHIKISEKHD